MFVPMGRTTRTAGTLPLLPLLPPLPLLLLPLLSMPSGRCPAAAAQLLAPLLMRATPPRPACTQPAITTSQAASTLTDRLSESWPATHPCFPCPHAFGAGMPISKSTAQLSHIYSGEELASAAATAAAAAAAGKSRFHPAHHPSGLPAHP